MYRSTKVVFDHTPMGNRVDSMILVKALFVGVVRLTQFYRLHRNFDDLHVATAFFRRVAMPKLRDSVPLQTVP